MATSTVENYIKRIYMEQPQAGRGLVTLGHLAKIMNVVPGTATTMVKALSESGLARYRPREGVRLTHAGEKLALHVLRRHRLIELFLVRVLGVDWSEVHAEAEELEHAISDKLLARIDEVLGRPAFDPHGDPIPSAAGKLSRSRVQPLIACGTGTRMRVARIADQDPRFLRYANSLGLVPGAKLHLKDRDALGDSILVQVSGRKPLNMGSSAGAKIMVEPLPKPRGNRTA
ncbi:MAG: metal-dependent transcriptional regulator [Tepidisphaeraceae bacterium]|jgi:DtxR family Mn-dependent transcriptional regulator